MTRLFNAIFGKKTTEKDDFSAFFGKPAGHKVKVLREVLREANTEQRKMIEGYRRKAEKAA